MTSRVDRPPPGRRRPGMALAVLVLHGLLLALLWQAMHRRDVDVAHDRSPLILLQVPAASPPRVDPPAELPRSENPPRRAVSPPPAAPRSTPLPAPHESTWVQPAAVAAVPTPAPVAAASAAPAERLLDTTATREAIRQVGRQSLLHERAAAATGLPVERTDSALAAQVAEAGTPDCLKDPKAASGQIGPIGLGGILGLPFLAARVASGRCAK